MNARYQLRPRRALCSSSTSSTPISLTSIPMFRTLLIPALALLIAGCGAEAHTDKDSHNHGAPAAAAVAPDDHAGHDHAGHNHGSEGVALTATVRENLGITFAKSEYRVVQGLLRVPASRPATSARS